MLSMLTLGAPGDEQTLDGMETVGTRRYFHHYNFPPFSVGETKPLRGPGRREIGHGALAEKALVPVLPDKETFPYTIRVVSEVLGSNGSSSMGSTCGSTKARRSLYRCPKRATPRASGPGAAGFSGAQQRGSDAQ